MTTHPHHYPGKGINYRMHPGTNGDSERVTRLLYFLAAVAAPTISLLRLALILPSLLAHLRCGRQRAHHSGSGWRQRHTGCGAGQQPHRGLVGAGRLLVLEKQVHSRLMLPFERPIREPCFCCLHFFQDLLAAESPSRCEPGLLETLDSLQDAGLRTTGAGRDAAEACCPAAVPLPDGAGRVLVWAMGHASSGVPFDWAAAKGRPGVFVTHLRKVTVTMHACAVAGCSMIRWAPLLSSSWLSLSRLTSSCVATRRTLRMSGCWWRRRKGRATLPWPAYTWCERGASQRARA